jgi:GNAT superfamily N-acetyltransferase
MNFKKYAEMTMSAGELSFTMPDFSHAEHIGDYENYKILHYKYQISDVYGIAETNSDKPIGYLQTIPSEIPDVEKINQIFVEPQFRNQNIMKKLFFFLKSWLKKSFIMGEIQSKDSQNFIKSLANTLRFPMFWINVKTKEKHEYDPSKDNFNLQPYRSMLEPTDWRILIEGLHDNKRLIDAIPVFMESTDFRRGYRFFE